MPVPQEQKQEQKQEQEQEQEDYWFIGSGWMLGTGGFVPSRV